MTRLQTAQAFTTKNHQGTDERIHMAQLVIVLATQAGWGFGGTQASPWGGAAERPCE